MLGKFGKFNSLAIAVIVGASALLTNGGLAFADTIGTSTANNHTSITCDLTIDKSVNTPNNKAIATGVCSQYESGYYDVNTEQYTITGLTNTIVTNDGQPFQMSTSEYDITLTVHLTDSGKSTVQQPSKPPIVVHSAGWYKENGKWVFYNKGGQKQVGWLLDKNIWYYMDANGNMVTGWANVKGKWYYLNASGAMQTGWAKVNGKWYYLNPSGDMKTGWILYNKKWYYLESSGAMVTGWKQINSKWYYFVSSGEMATNTSLNGYQVGADGVRINSVNWLQPTGGAYPVMGQHKSVWIKVSIAEQRVYILDGNQTIYTMICSTGTNSTPTPTGTYYIQAERGYSFYSRSSGEGARYWVSWLHHGEYLFHSVPIDKYGNYIPNEAVKLGQKASHGCVRLSVSDAKWIYDNIKYGTKVVIN